MPGFMYAGHNSNTDKPEEVNRIIREFVTSLKETVDQSDDSKKAETGED